MARRYSLDFGETKKILVGEGESDLRFLSEFCSRNGIEGFGYAFAGMENDRYTPSGFDVFEHTLAYLTTLSNFDEVTDIVVVCDSGERPASRASEVKTKLQRANRSAQANIYNAAAQANVPTVGHARRTHVLIQPVGEKGGLESICFGVAVEALNIRNPGSGSEIEQWINEFADKACVGWTTEKRDKLRLQALLSAASKTKPDIHFSQLFDITADRLVPLDGASFDYLRRFLGTVAAL